MTRSPSSTCPMTCSAAMTFRSRRSSAQRAAIAKWATPRKRPYDYLKAIQQPTLVVNGSNDVIIYTMNSFILQQNLPNAQLIIYPDSPHASHHQYPSLFVRHSSMFLSAAQHRAHSSFQ